MPDHNARGRQALAFVLASVLALSLFTGCATVERVAPLQGKPGCAGDPCAAESEDARAARILLEFVGQEAERIRPRISDISDRSRLFGPDVRRLDQMLDGVQRVKSEGLQMLARGDLHGAEARLESLLVALPVLTVRLNYALWISHAEDAGVPTPVWMQLAEDVNRKTSPLMDAMVGFDPERIRQALRVHGDGLAELEARLPSLDNSLHRGAALSRKALAVANSVMLVLAAHQVVTAFRSPLGSGPDLTLRFPGLASAGPATAALGSGVVVIPAEILESLRHLIRIGAISSVVFSVGSGPALGIPEFVRMDERSAVSGEATPSAAQPPEAAESGLDDLARFRRELGLKHGEGALARLDVGGRRFYGINAHGQQVHLRVNAITRTHAETDVFQQAANAGLKGGRATLYVDRALCDACGPSGGIRGLARQLGLDELEIVTPQGRQVVRP